MSDFDELYVMARRVLLDALDALDALGDHRDALVLVGAQAVYLRVGDADLAVTPYTTDGDLVVDPEALAESPPLERALMGAGFSPKTKDSVGVWLTTRKTSQQADANIAVDLLVPASVSPGTGRRAARLPGHDTRAARIVRGLDGAIVDADVMRLAALEQGDARTVDVRVAGPAASGHRDRRPRRPLREAPRRRAFRGGRAPRPRAARGAVRQAPERRRRDGDPLGGSSR